MMGGLVVAHPRILVVEDDDELARLLIEYLSQHGFEMSRIADGHAGATAILEDPPDLVILDLMLPGANGLDVCRRVRDLYRGAILMLTASQSEADHVAGLELGADDFVNKPIEPRILLARVRAQLRRRQGRSTSPSNDETLLFGSLSIDPLLRNASVAGVPLPLTTMEFDILLMLARHSGAVLNREDLYREILNIEYDGIDRGMDVHVSRIRRKLEACGFDPRRLKSVRGAGYLLAVR